MSDGLYLPFSIAEIVCLVTLSMLATSCCVRSCSALSTFSLLRQDTPCSSEVFFLLFNQINSFDFRDRLILLPVNRL